MIIMKKFTWFLLSQVVCLVIQAQPAFKLEADQVKKTIDSLNVEMEKAFNANDMKATAAFYSDDAEIVASNYRVFGRKNLDEYWNSLRDKGRGWKLTVFEVGGIGEFVYQLGNSDLTHISNGKESKSVTNFVLVWRKQKDGAYKIFRDYLTNTKFEKD